MRLIGPFRPPGRHLRRFHPDNFTRSNVQPAAPASLEASIARLTDLVVKLEERLMRMEENPRQNMESGSCDAPGGDDTLLQEIEVGHVVDGLWDEAPPPAADKRGRAKYRLTLDDTGNVSNVAHTPCSPPDHVPRDHGLGPGSRCPELGMVFGNQLAALAYCRLPVACVPLPFPLRVCVPKSSSYPHLPGTRDFQAHLGRSRIGRCPLERISLLPGLRDHKPRLVPSRHGSRRTVFL